MKLSVRISLWYPSQLKVAHLLFNDLSLVSVKLLELENAHFRVVQQTLLTESVFSTLKADIKDWVGLGCVFDCIYRKIVGIFWYWMYPVHTFLEVNDDNLIRTPPQQLLAEWRWMIYIPAESRSSIIHGIESS